MINNIVVLAGLKVMYFCLSQCLIYSRIIRCIFLFYMYICLILFG